MTLPPAKQDTSKHPQVGSVTASTGKDIQSAEVDRKMHLYKVIEALWRGRMPDNYQIDKTLSYLRDAKPDAINKLSPDGKKFICDCRYIIETARLIIQWKNVDGLFQNFVWHTRDIDGEFATPAPAEAPQVDRDKLFEDSCLAVRHLRPLLLLIPTNSEVRELFSDFSVIGRDLLAKGAAKDGLEIPTEEFEGRKRDLKECSEGTKDKLAECFPHDQKKHAAENIQKGAPLLTDEYFPAKRRDQYIYRGKKVIMECQRNNDYQNAIKWLLSIAEEYAECGQSATEIGKESVTTIINDPSLRQAVSELRLLLDRFAFGGSMDNIFDSIDYLNDDARQDKEFRVWFKRLNAFIRKLLLEAGYVLGDDCNREGKEICKSGRKFWDQKYRAHFDNVFDSVGDWFCAMDEDPLSEQFGGDWEQLTWDLLFDNEGSLKFKSELWSDIRSVILPMLLDKIGYLPIPRIEYSDDASDLVLENLTFQGRNLFPNIVTFSPYNNIPDEHHHEFTFTFAQMQADLRDVAFFFRKKTGFLRVVDSGVADMVIGGSGLTAIVHLVSAGSDRSSVFKVKDVHVKVGSLKFSIRDSKHDLLYKILRPLVTSLVKWHIKRVVAGAIRTGVEYPDGQLVSIRDRVEEARSSDDMSLTRVLQEQFERHKEEHGIRSSESRPQFKFVFSKHSSMIDTAYPAARVSHVSGSKQKEVTGKEWMSEAFTTVWRRLLDRFGMV